MRRLVFLSALSALILVPSVSYASVELCSELMVESYDLEEFEPWLEEWETVKDDDGGAVQTMETATGRVKTTGRLIANDVFSNRYERELARSVEDAAQDVEKALDAEDVEQLYPAYEVLMETVDYLTRACFTRPDAERAQSSEQAKN